MDHYGLSGPTPRTDAMVLHIKVYECDVVSAEFARVLERELNVFKERYLQLRADMEAISTKNA